MTNLEKDYFDEERYRNRQDLQPLFSLLQKMNVPYLRTTGNNCLIQDDLDKSFMESLKKKVTRIGFKSSITIRPSGTGYMIIYTAE